jgi:NAD(P)-dependent dehydrogenase (short-subunit alcohol dehydrogenase family)
MQDEPREEVVELGLEGKTAIVTGASRGIGEAIAHVLAEYGADVCLVARSSGDLERVASDIKSRTNRRVHVHVADLMDPKAPSAAVAAATAALGRLDILINNAGATKRGDFFELTDEDWASGFGLKFFGAMRMTRSAWPHLRASNGAIVNIIGIGSRTAAAEFTIGGSVNSALLNFTKATADLGRTQGVRVNAINPGHIQTGRLEGRIATTMKKEGLGREEAMRHMTAKYGIARFGEPREIGELAAFLCSKKAAFMLGAIVDMDGGETRAL